MQMKKWIMIILWSLLFCTLSATSLCAFEKQLDGHWEGAINQPGGELKIAVDFRTEGNMSGKFTLLASAVFKWPLKVVFASPNLKFRLPMGLLFDGEIQGDTISGKVPSPTGGHVDSFFLKRKRAAPLPYKEEEVRFQNAGVTLAGTLRLPLTKGRHPALFLLQGSGDVDREGESFYADYFARHGIVTLVYDKRGTGKFRR